MDQGDKLIENVARRMGELREKAKLSQADVAERIGTTVSNYQRIEHGLQNVTLRTLSKIAEAIGIEPKELFVSATAARARPGRPKKK